MTIDEACDKIKGKPEESPKQEGNQTPDITDKPLEQAAREILGKTLISFYEGKLPGQHFNNVSQNPLSQTTRTVLLEHGYDFLSLAPLFGANGILIQPRMSEQIDDETVKQMLATLCGKYILKTDFKEIAKADNIGRIKELVPEWRSMEYELFGIDHALAYKRSTVYPHIITLEMEKSRRPLAVLASEEHVKSITIPDLPLNPHLSTIMNATLGITPPMRIFLKFAEKYDIKNVKEVMSEFKRACDVYVQAWGKA